LALSVPTFETTERFRKDLASLSRDETAVFRRAVEKFVEDLKAGRFRAGLRVKGIKGAPGIFEMTWADDGRATFQYGPPKRRREPHIIWRRCGTHDIFSRP
jgi:hypothetical protein